MTLIDSVRAGRIHSTSDAVKGVLPFFLGPLPSREDKEAAQEKEINPDGEILEIDTPLPCISAWLFWLSGAMVLVFGRCVVSSVSGLRCTDVFVLLHARTITIGIMDELGENVGQAPVFHVHRR